MKTKMPLQDAERIARGMVGALSPLCSRVEIAGSIRRRAPMVGDLEIVCISRMEPGLGGDIPMLDRVDWNLYGSVLANGPRQKKIILPDGIQLDLFITTPDRWGVIFTLQTGPENFSTRLVTKKGKGGFLPGYMRVEDGFLWSRNHVIPTLEEEDFFTAIDLPCPDPERPK